MITITVVGVLVALAALVWFANHQTGVVLRTIAESQEPAETPPEPPYDDSRLWEAIERLTSAVAEGIDHVERKSKRIDGVIASAKRRFEAEGYQDPGLDAEADSLPQLDAFGGGEEQLQDLPNDVAPNPFSAVPGLMR